MNIVVTGASSGIGKACALGLAKAGHRVFAGVRSEKDSSLLNALGEKNLHPFFLDVTKTDLIQAAAEQISKQVGKEGLQAIVNNAGIVVAGPLEFLPVDELKKQFDVNVFGQIAVTQSFLPMIRQGMGRIVMVSSVSGRVAVPFLGAYCGSKFALEALTDSLRMELRSWGIPVILIEPGRIATPIWEKSESAADKIIENMSAQAVKLYGQMAENMRARVKKVIHRSSPVETVLDVVSHAVLSKNPKSRYIVGKDARLQILMKSTLGTSILDSVLTTALGFKR